MNQTEEQIRKDRKKKEFGHLIIMLLLIGAFSFGVYYVQQGGKKGKFERVAKNVLNSVNENYKNEKMLDEVKDDVTYDFPNKEIIDFNEGSLKGGKIIRYADGSVAMALYNDKYCAKKARSAVNIEITDYVEGNCTVY